jgi:hypothetical protein
VEELELELEDGCWCRYSVVDLDLEFVRGFLKACLCLTGCAWELSEMLVCAEGGFVRSGR